MCIFIVIFLGPISIILLLKVLLHPVMRKTRSLWSLDVAAITGNVVDAVVAIIAAGLSQKHWSFLREPLWNVKHNTIVFRLLCQTKGDSSH